MASNISAPKPSNPRVSSLFNRCRALHLPKKGCFFDPPTWLEALEEELKQEEETKMVGWLVSSNETPGFGHHFFGFWGFFW